MKQSIWRKKKVDIKDVVGISDKLRSLLIDNDINDSNNLFDAKEDELLEIKGLGAKTLEKIKDKVTEHLQSAND